MKSNSRTQTAIFWSLAVAVALAAGTVAIMVALRSSTSPATHSDRPQEESAVVSSSDPTPILPPLSVEISRVIVNTSGQLQVWRSRPVSGDGSVSSQRPAKGSILMRRATLAEKSMSGKWWTVISANRISRLELRDYRTDGSLMVTGVSGTQLGQEHLGTVEWKEGAYESRAEIVKATQTIIRQERGVFDENLLMGHIHFSRPSSSHAAPAEAVQPPITGLGVGIRDVACTADDLQGSWVSVQLHGGGMVYWTLEANRFRRWRQISVDGKMVDVDQGAYRFVPPCSVRLEFMLNGKAKRRAGLRVQFQPTSQLGVGLATISNGSKGMLWLRPGEETSAHALLTGRWTRLRVQPVTWGVIELDALGAFEGVSRWPVIGELQVSKGGHISGKMRIMRDQPQKSIRLPMQLQPQGGRP